MLTVYKFMPKTERADQVFLILKNEGPNNETVTLVRF